MKIVSASDAKRHFGEFLTAAERGEKIVIRRHHKPIALLCRLNAILALSQDEQDEMLGYLDLETDQEEMPDLIDLTQLLFSERKKKCPTKKK